MSKANDKNKWEVSNAEPRGLWYTLRWTLPCLWTGGIWLKMQVIATVMLIILGKVLSVSLFDILGIASTYSQDGY